MYLRLLYAKTEGWFRSHSSYKTCGSPVKVDNEKWMFDIIRASFNQRRKTQANGLSNSDKIDLPKDVITEAIAKLGKGESVRGESLSLEEFAALSNDLWEKKGR